MSTTPASIAARLSAPAAAIGALARSWPSAISLSNCCLRATAATIRSSSGLDAPTIRALWRHASSVHPTLVDHPLELEQDDPVGDLLHLGEQVAADQDGRLRLLKAVRELPDLQDPGRIQPVRGLVQGSPRSGRDGLDGRGLGGPLGGASTPNPDHTRLPMD